MTLLFMTSIAAFVIALAMTPLIRKMALKFEIYAKPNHRTIHKDIVPLLGGVAIFASYIVGFGIIAAFPSPYLTELIRESFIFLIGGTLILFLGIYDDIRGADSYQKFSVQILAALIVIMSGYKVSTIILPFTGVISLGILSIPFTMLWIVGITNAINLIDGLDGLAAGISFGAACVMMAVSLWSGNLASAFPAAILASSLAAFLFFNFNPAKIFLGDSGSLFIGFMLACFSINGTFRESSAVAMLAPIIVLGIPITDTLLAFTRRVRRGVHPFRADKEHIHHRLMNLGLNHRQVVLLMNGISWFWGIIALVIFLSNDANVLFLLLFIPAILIYGLKKLGFAQYFV